ncbi:GPI transamidase component GPI17 [Pseudozyma hubeiensis]|nr:GPI transamidase component GPI17 [Pseudozyma hubeiensis]
MAAPLMFQSLGTRIAVLACFWVALLASIPSWLRLTTIQRLPLPTKQVEALQHPDGCPVTFQSSLAISVDTTILPEDGDQEEEKDAQASFLKQVEQLVQQSLEIKAGLPAAASLECTRWKVDVHATSSAELLSPPLDPETGAYAVRVASETSSDDADAHQSGIPTVYLPSPTDELASLPLVPDTISAAVVAELLHLRGDKPPPTAADDTSATAISDTQHDPRVIQYSRHVRLVFSIMNQDATDGSAYDSQLIHDLASANASTSNPITRLTSELSGLHDFHVETQVQWFAPLQFQPTREILEEVVEMDVEEEMMVDQEVEEVVDVEVDDEDPAEAEVGSTSTAEADTEAFEVEQEVPSVSSTGRRKKTIQQTQRRTIQVPRIERTRKQIRTPLPPRNVIEWDDLKVFVNSQEWSLTSTVPPSSSAPTRNHTIDGRPYDVLSQTHDLHFLLYIPSRTNSPLFIRDIVKGGVEDAGGWLIPQWGGVVILNAEDQMEGENGLILSDQRGGGGGEGKVMQLSQAKVVQAMTLFSRQLEILLGLSDIPTSPLQRSIRLSTLQQRRTLELARETTSTLTAITRLVDRIENLGVGPPVKSDVQSSLHIIQSLAAAQNETQSLAELFERVREAHALSNRAFFNPDMLGLLYFPDEHKYAVYTPLFAPLLVPLIVTTVKLLRELAEKRAGRKGGIRSRRTSTRNSL